MKLISMAGLALLLIVNSVNIFADSAKIGVVDLQKIMQTSTQMKDIQKKLETEFKPRRDKLVAMEANLKKDMDKFKRDNSVMNDTQKKDLEKNIVSQQQSFERQGQQYQQELSAAHNEAMEGLYNKIRQAIKTIAELKKYDLILQKDVALFNTLTLDITALVVKELG